MADRNTSCAAFIAAPTRTRVDREQLAQLLSTAAASFRSLAILAPLQRRLAEFLDEAKQFIDLVAEKNLDDIRAYILSTKHLFKGAVGVRHVDFIAYKPI